MPRSVLHTYHYLLDVATESRVIVVGRSLTVMCGMKCSCGDAFLGATWADALFAIEQHFEKKDAEDA